MLENAAATGVIEVSVSYSGWFGNWLQGFNCPTFLFASVEMSGECTAYMHNFHCGIFNKMF